MLAGLLTATAGFVPLLLLSGDSSAALVLLGTGIVGCGFGLTRPVVDSRDHERPRDREAGDEAAVNQVARQVGGALGVAIVGSVFAAVYAAEVRRRQPRPAAAKESIEDATETAGRLQGTARIELLDDAVASFDVAARWGLAVCMAVLVVAAAGAAIGLSNGRLDRHHTMESLPASSSVPGRAHPRRARHDPRAHLQGDRDRRRAERGPGPCPSRGAGPLGAAADAAPGSRRGAARLDSTRSASRSTARERPGPA